MLDLRELTITQYHNALIDGKLTVEELVRFYLDRINRYDSKLKSIISINPKAIDQAKVCDELIRKYAGKAELLREQIALNLPLHGVPVLVKDNIETEELPTTAGSLSLKDFSTGKDAEIAKRLRKAGAIILAKTNLHEFAIWGETISSIKGQTLNPWDLSRTPGGSSGGTGAALAANFGMAFLSGRGQQIRRCGGAALVAGGTGAAQHLEPWRGAAAATAARRVAHGQVAHDHAVRGHRSDVGREEGEKPRLPVRQRFPPRHLKS